MGGVPFSPSIPERPHMRHKISDMLSSVRLVLPILYETVLDNGATWATACGPADAKNSCALLQGILDQAPGPNSAYTLMPQSAASCT